jgi:hypothetical protein
MIVFAVEERPLERQPAAASRYEMRCSERRGLKALPKARGIGGAD